MYFRVFKYTVSNGHFLKLPSRPDVQLHAAPPGPPTSQVYYDIRFTWEVLLSVFYAEHVCVTIGELTRANLVLCTLSIQIIICLTVIILLKSYHKLTVKMHRIELVTLDQAVIVEVKSRKKWILGTIGRLHMYLIISLYRKLLY